MRKLNDLEQHSRKDNVSMFGVSDPNKLETAENTVDVVKVLRGIDVAIGKNDIHITHRLGLYAEKKKKDQSLSNLNIGFIRTKHYITGVN